MKKLLAMVLALVMLLSFASCAATEEPKKSEEKATEEATSANETIEATADEEEIAPVKVDYAGYVEAALETKVTIEAYVQATQSWWDDKITVYAQDQDGAYFIYELACSEDDAKKLVPGTKISVTGYKAEWSGEIEITDGTFEFVEGADTFIAEAFDATSLLGTEDLIKHQNELVSFKGLTVKSIAYKNDAPGEGNDIYVTLTKDNAEYSFCVEAYLTGPDSDVYKAAGELKEGEVIDVEGYLYWYEGANTHITAITAAA